MEKLNYNGKFDGIIDIINNTISNLKVNNKEISLIDIFISTNNRSFDFKEISLVLSNIELTKNFPKIEKNEFIKYIEEKIIKNEFNSLDINGWKFMSKFFSYNGKYSELFYIFFNEEDFKYIIKNIGNLLLEKYKDQYLNDNVRYFINNEKNNYGFSKIIYDSYKSGLITNEGDREDIIINLILNKGYKVSSDELKNTIKSFLLQFDGGIFGGNVLSNIQKEIYPNISKFLEEKEIITLISRFDYTINSVLLDNNLNSKIIESICEKTFDFYNNLIQQNYNFHENDNCPVRLENVLKYIRHNKVNLKLNTYEKFFKLITLSKDNNTIFRKKDILFLLGYLFNNYHFPIKIIEKILEDKNHEYIELLSKSETKFLNKEHLLKMINLNNLSITSNVMKKAGQYDLNVGEILGF